MSKNIRILRKTNHINHFQPLASSRESLDDIQPSQQRWIKLSFELGLSEKNGLHRMDFIGPRYASSNCPELGDKLNWDQLTGGAFGKLSMKVQTDPG